MSLSSCIDWLSMTFHSQDKSAEFILSIKDYGPYIEVNARFGYDKAVQYECGMVAMWSLSRDDMGCHIILSGSTLEALAVAGNSARELLERAIGMHAKITRLDLAIDAQNEGIEIVKIYDAVAFGVTTGSAKSINLITGNDGGATMYVGSRVSDKFARLYDKGIQSKIGGDWKRLEVEMKGDVAKEFARVVAMNKHDTIGSFTWAIASKMFFTDTGNYPVLGTHSTALSMPKIEKKTDTEKWLYNQIIPILEKYIANHPDSQVYDEIIQALIRAKGDKGLTKQ